jgi:hypothetical protein
MSDTSGRFRMRTIVEWSDPDFSVRRASVDDLIRVQYDNQANGWRARWSSEEALRSQVKPDSTAFLCPLVRNGAPVDEPISYRCHISFALKSENGIRAISFIDVGKELLSTLTEASNTDQLKSVIRSLLDGSPIASIW